MTTPEIFDLVREMKISDENDLCFMSAVVILYGIFNNTVSYNKIKKGTDLPMRDVIKITDNVRSNGIIGSNWSNADLDTSSQLNFTVSLTLLAMVGAGEIVRYEIPEPINILSGHESTDEVIDKITNKVDSNKLLPLPNRCIRVITNGEKNWIRPVSLVNGFVEGVVQSLKSDYYEQGEIIKVDVTSIISIDGLKKSKVEEIKNKIKCNPEQ